MGLSPRLEGKAAARRRHTHAGSGILDRIGPFFATGDVNGGPLLLAAITALLCVNLPFGAGFEQFWDTELSIHFGAAHVALTLAEWINDALLPVFFIIIGAEVKREVVIGELSQWRSAAFPLFGSLGGMIVPVAIFLAINHAGPDRAAWGTVVTTDTAFGLAIIALFATGLPSGVRTLLLAFAAVDDVGGLLVIAGAYTDHIAWAGLAIAGIAMAGMIGLRLRNVVSPVPYLGLALLCWAGIFGSGVHATIAGVLIGLVIPARPRLDQQSFAEDVQEKVDEFQEAHEKSNPQGPETSNPEAQRIAEERLGYLHEMTAATDEPGAKVIALLTPWISYLVLPLFALSNVRIHLSFDLLVRSVFSPLAIGVFLGLAVGKPLGFLSFSWIATKVGIAQLPERVTWPMILGVGCLAGIGFTISLFIAALAFDRGPALEMAAFAILIASTISAVAGYYLLSISKLKHDIR